MTRQEMIRQNEIALEAFMLHGGVVTVLKTYKPRKSERVLSGMRKYSISNMGHKGASLGRNGMFANVGV